MKEFKQTPKMHAEGKHYCGGKSVKKYADGGSIDNDVRSRAMKWIEAGSPEQTTTPIAKNQTVKTQPESDREENSSWMREMRKQEATDTENKRESTALARRYPEKRTPSKMIRDEAEIAQRPTLETKGSKLLKDAGIKIGYKRGGKVKRGAK